MAELVFTNVFTKLAEAAGRTQRYVSSCGGTRSGKTFSMLQFLYLLAASDTTPTITSVVSETLPNLRRGAMRDFRTIVGDAWREEWWSETKCSYTFPSGAMIEFFGADSPDKVHGPGRDRLFLNEAQNIKYEVARQLFVRTRDYVFLDYNPTHEFWLNTRTEALPECVCIHSTYLDNVDRRTGKSTLSEAQIREIESNKDDANWWRVYGEGKTGKLEGLIYPEFEQIDAMPEGAGMVDLFGLDFGYSNDPTALVRVLADTRRKVLYLDERIFEKGLLNKHIIERLREQGVSRTAEIFADCAEPKSIDEITFAGFNCKKCYKGNEVVEQIQFVQGWKICATKGSVNLVKELRNYRWAQNKDGVWLNVPEKGGAVKYDHALDAVRYAVFTKFGVFRKPLRSGTPRVGSAW